MFVKIDLFRTKGQLLIELDSFLYNSRYTSSDNGYIQFLGIQIGSSQTFEEKYVVDETIDPENKATPPLSAVGMRSNLVDSKDLLLW